MQDKIQKAIESGFSAIPWVTIEGNTTPSKFKGRTYPLTSPRWANYDHNLFSIHLQDCVLIDVDANKGGDVNSLHDAIFDLIGLDEFDLDEALFQTNDTGDSLHYLFLAPEGINQDDYNHHNDGRSIKLVDFKTGNQLVHIKDGKTVTWVNKNELPRLTLEQFETIFKKRDTTATNTDDDFGLMSAVTSRPDESLNDDDVMAVLDKIDVSVVGHDEWFRIGLGISHQYQNSEKGKEIFKLFSQRFGDDYDEREIDSRWPTFKDESRSERVTFKSVSAMVRTNERESLKRTLSNDQYRQRANEIVGSVAHQCKESFGFDLEIDRDMVQLMLKGSFWNATQAKINMTNNDDELVIFPESKAAEMLVTRFGQPIENLAEFTQHLASLELNASDMRKAKAILINRVISSIQFNSQGDSLTYCVDMFTDRTYFDVDNSSVTVNFKYLPLTLKGKHFRVECPQSVEAYKRHFPECDEFLRMIVASRFASSRKKAYVWLKCPSDWGKDVFRNALGDFHFEMSVSEVEKALEGSPVGKSPKNMFRAFAMVTNEFKKVKSELKQLEDDITVAAKYQLETTVPLYSKIFMSAEGVDSLIGEYGVEAQFANRFSMIEGRGRMSDIKEFNEFGNTHFVNAVTTYIVDFINAEVDSYRAMTKSDATKKGDQVVIDFHAKHGLKYKSKTIDESLPEIAEDVKAELIKRYSFDCPVEAGVMMLKAAKTKVQDVIRNGELFTTSERYTIAHKADEIMSLMSIDGEGVRIMKVEGKSSRVLPIAMKMQDDFDDI